MDRQVESDLYLPETVTRVNVFEVIATPKFYTVEVKGKKKVVPFPKKVIYPGITVVVGLPLNQLSKKLKRNGDSDEFDVFPFNKIIGILPRKTKNERTKIVPIGRKVVLWRMIGEQNHGGVIRHEMAFDQTKISQVVGFGIPPDGKFHHDLKLGDMVYVDWKQDQIEIEIDGRYCLIANIKDIWWKIDRDDQKSQESFLRENVA